MNEETIKTTALELWKRWFKFSGEPWEENGYGGAFCFFCREDMPNHAPDCVFVEAKKLLALDTTNPVVSYEMKPDEPIKLVRLSDVKDIGLNRGELLAQKRLRQQGEQDEVSSILSNRLQP